MAGYAAGASGKPVREDTGHSIPVSPADKPDHSPSRPRGQENSVLIRIELTLSRDARYLGVLRQITGCVMQQVQAPEQVVRDVQLAVTEACSNAVRHAPGTATYHIALEIDDGECQIEVVDLGPGFPTDVQADAARDPHAESGRGIGLMRQLVDAVEFGREDEATRLRLTKRWPCVVE